MQIILISPVLAMIYLLRKGPRGGGKSMGNNFFGDMLGISKSGSKIYTNDNVKERFKDVAGMTGPKQEIMEFVNFLKEPQK